MVNYFNIYSQNQEDYLKTIYYLKEMTDSRAIKSVFIAKRLSISKAAVSKMIGRLKSLRLVKTSPYSAVDLTREGEKQAKMLVRKHRIIEVFLARVLKVSKNKIHREAHKLEHAFSSETIKKLELFLGSPRFCPEGHPIPEI